MNQSNSRHDSGERGSLIVTAAVAAAVISILIGGMLTYLSNEHRFEVRGHAWAQAMYLAEAGLEMGFAEFNNYYITGQGGFAQSRGWWNLGGGEYVRWVPSFTNGQGQDVGYVYSYVRGVGSPNPYLFAYGGLRTIPTGGIVYRAVEARLSINSQFPAAMVARGWLNMNGQNVYTDSFDSSDPTKSTNNRYDESKRQANGDVASNDTITNTVDVMIGNADIYGRVMVSPSGAVTMGPNGSMGPTFVSGERATTVAQAQNAGWLRNDFQVDIPDVSLPSGAAAWPAPAAGASISGSATISTGDYKLNSISLSGQNVLTINGPGIVRLYITGNTSVSGKAQIKVSSNATLIVYAAGSVSIAGNGMINHAGRSINTQFYGLPTSTSWSISGNGQWVGTIYAPNADLSINGGGSRGDVSGAIVAKNITLNGHVQFHYDESLRSSGPNASFDIASWKSYRWTGNAWVSD